MKVGEKATINQKRHSVARKIDPFQDFTVADPVQIGDKLTGHVKYTVSGSYQFADSDEIKDFKVQRRFKEFISLCKALRERWPGINIPSIPEKKGYQSTKAHDAFIEERRGYL